MSDSDNKITVCTEFMKNINRRCLQLQFYLPCVSNSVIAISEFRENFYSPIMY